MVRLGLTIEQLGYLRTAVEADRDREEWRRRRGHPHWEIPLQVWAEIEQAICREREALAKKDRAAGRVPSIP